MIDESLQEKVRFWFRRVDTRWARGPSASRCAAPQRMAVVLQAQVRLTKPPSGDLISKTPMLFEAFVRVHAVLVPFFDGASP
jgi:hypothetical protein